MAETDLWFGTLSATVRVEDLPASRRVVAIELPAVGQWRVCGVGTSNASGIATLPITGLPTSRIYAVAIDDWGRPFVPGMTVAFGDVIRPTQFLGWMYQVTSPGELPSTEPDWWNNMAGVPQPVGTAMMQAIRHYQPIAHGPVSDIEWEEREFDPYWDNVVALLHFDGNLTDGTGRVWSGSNVTFVNSGLGSVFEQEMQKSRVTTPNHEDLLMRSSDFTIELWFRAAAPETGYPLLFAKRQSANNSVEIQLYSFHLGSLACEFWDGNQQKTSILVNSGTDPLVPGKYYHVAVCGHQGTILSFLNGELRDSTLYSSLRVGTSPLMVGGGVDGSTYPGGVDEFRITKGVARYTEDFDPPTAPFPNVGPPL